MIIEGLVTTINEDGTVNLAPMGPETEPAFQQLILKPYPTSTTYQNLQRSGTGVFHVTDDVELLAQTAVGKPDPWPALTATPDGAGQILSGACGWFAFRVQSVDASQERIRIEARVTDRGHLREFVGFNRAKHAVVEAAILATRVRWLKAEEIFAQLERLEPLVQKTGGPAERRAWDFLTGYLREAAGPSGK